MHNNAKSQNYFGADNATISDIFFPFILISIIATIHIISSPSPTFADSTDIIDEIGIEVPISCTMSGSGISSHNADIPNGTYTADIGTTTMHAFCNDNSGFAIYAAGYTGNEIGATNSNKLIGTNASSNATIVTGTATSAGNPDISNWAMKLTVTQDSGDTTGTNAFTIDSAPNTSGGSNVSFTQYHTVPNEYTKVAHKNAGTDMTSITGGVKLTTTYAVYISKTQPADTYSGQVIYTLVHPSNEIPAQPIATEPGKICYYPNTAIYEGTMGCQDVTSSITLLASNFSREGYGFAGWSTTYDYSDTSGFYGPQETITLNTADYSDTNNGLSLYAHWIKSAGNLQNWSGCPSLQSGAVTALTDQRDNDTYAVAKLADGKCWMIENLRLDNTATLTIANTNNPLNDGTNVTLKHNYTDTDTYNTLSTSSNVIYDVDTAPDGWCNVVTVDCYDQSRLNTDNTTNRTTGNPDIDTSYMYSYGNYYNWYSATAGKGTYGFATKNSSVGGDLCPSGWHLPKGGNKSNEANSEFWALIVTGINNGVNPSDYDNTTQPYYTGDPEGNDASRAVRKYPNNFVYSGYVGDTSIGGLGTYSGYWTSTASSNYYAYLMDFNSKYVVPGGNVDTKSDGWSVRCVNIGT